MSMYPHPFWTTAIQYLHLVEIVTAEIVKQGNVWGVEAPYNISEEEFREMTKWSDFRIAVPLLFNFYHGVELLLKGFLIAKNEFQSIHQISILFDKFHCRPTGRQ